MMRGLYAIGIRLYGFAIRLAALWQPKAKAWFDGRRNWQSELKQAAPANGFDLWMHCASLGEFEQGRPVLEGYRKKHPQHKLLLTFYSPSGYEVRKQYDKVNFVGYLPLDTKSNCAKFLHLTNPKICLFVKYDCWPNLLITMQAQQRKAFLIAAQFRSSDLYHGLLKNWTRPLLEAFQKIFLQQGPKVPWLPIDQKIVGDPRVDRVVEIQQATEIEGKLSRWKNGEVMIWGSVWPKDWPLIKAVINGPLAGWQHLIAPHNIALEDIKKLEVFLEQSSALFTSEVSNERLVFLNTIGHLSAAYRLGDLAYIGGGFGSGIHNILEPLAAGLPTFFGPKHHKFPEAAAAIEQKCGFEIQSSSEMLPLVQSLLTPAALKSAQREALQFINERSGATQIILADIEAIK